MAVSQEDSETDWLPQWTLSFLGRGRCENTAKGTTLYAQPTSLSVRVLLRPLLMMVVCIHCSWAAAFDRYQCFLLRGHRLSHITIMPRLRGRQKWPPPGFQCPQQDQLKCGNAGARCWISFSVCHKLYWVAILGRDFLSCYSKKITLSNRWSRLLTPLSRSRPKEARRATQMCSGIRDKGCLLTAMATKTSAELKQAVFDPRPGVP